MSDGKTVNIVVISNIVESYSALGLLIDSRGWITDRGYCVVFLDKTLFSHGASPHQGVGTHEFLVQKGQPDILLL